MSEINLEQLAKLRVPFEAHQISKLPKETKKQAEDRKANMNLGVKCQLCGGWHHKDAVHLDYVGHAAATDRLLDVDLEWDWEPMAFDANGLPQFDRNGGLWIKLTVCGKTRIGYGNADGKQGGDAVKEIIGDAIRNGGMRFGMALDLWHKGDLHVEPVLTMAEKAIADIEAIKTGEALGAWWADNAKKLKATLDAEDWAVVEQAKNDAKALFTQEGVPQSTQQTPFDEAA